MFFLTFELSNLGCGSVSAVYNTSVYGNKKIINIVMFMMFFFCWQFCATLGALCVPLAYLTVWELTKSTGAAILGTAFIVFGRWNCEKVVKSVSRKVRHSGTLLLIHLSLFHWSSYLNRCSGSVTLSCGAGVGCIVWFSG